MLWTKVLIVDDEIEFASALVERLLLRSYDAWAVYSADDALTEVKANVPDVMLLDIKMPGMNGIELFKTIQEFNPHIEAIFVTGHGSLQGGEEELPRGAFDYVMKPIDIDELTRKIDAARQRQMKRRSGE